MEGIQTINALKAVVSSLPAQTTIPSSELVMLYAADGTPIAKIARDDLVKAVASVMASNSQNTFSKLLGVQANGTPMGIGASDLASVLGAKQVEVNNGLDFNSDLENGVYAMIGGTYTNYPGSDAELRGYLVVYNRHSLYKAMVVYDTKNNINYMRVCNQGGWTAWQRIDNYGTTSLAGLDCKRAYN
jgi:hypothetical protein